MGTQRKITRILKEQHEYLPQHLPQMQKKDVKMSLHFLLKQNQTYIFRI